MAFSSSRTFPGQSQQIKSTRFRQFQIGDQDVDGGILQNTYGFFGGLYGGDLHTALLGDIGAQLSYVLFVIHYQQIHGQNILTN
jgi:hypothetical protein